MHETPAPTPPPDPRPVLLALRALKLGDLLVAVPALKGLRRAFPDHRIVLATSGWLAPVVGLIPAVDELLPTDGLDDPPACEPGQVDIAVNLHGNGPESRAWIDALGARLKIVHRSPADPGGVPWIDGTHERVRWARLVNAFGASADPDDVSIEVPVVDAEALAAGDTAGGARDIAIVHVGAAYGSRHWPADRFARVASELERDGLRVLVTGGAAEADRAREIARAAGLDEGAMLAGRAGLRELAALVAAARIVVTVDTGAAHLASAYGTPSVIVFGPAPPEEWGPPPGPHIVLTAPELRRGDAFAADPDPALLAVGAEQVLSAARSLLEGGRAAHTDREEPFAQHREDP
ncbi:glycosyltransferase family 9 protein [Leucobacter ruminantium]|uniref:Glycosyltransferase family 9 protein n=1 Tax=Leucobacter ruminantium TaxID=1289170 RepID=A0A939LUG3_9MICO|nr:glycosyltransferase family 9 protein [Leucobacter ruminantium]MBO1804316.1 glycosyltransferase family 9 protein [Leucobacter ruminantium]